MQISVFDLVVLSPLEIDSLPFDSVVKLLNVEEFLLGREWFQHSDLGPDQVQFSLKRALGKGLIICRGDSSVEGPAITQPPLALMKDCWYDLTPVGESIARLPVPWDYEVRSWTFPSRESKLAALVEDLRGNPQRWFYEHTSPVPTSARGTRGWSSHRAIVRRANGDGIFAHTIDRLNVRLRELLQGHFRPMTRDLVTGPEVQRSVKEASLTNVDLMVLDVLHDDIESLSLILAILNHEDAPYRKWHFGQDFSNEEVSTSLAALVDKGYVVAYEEVAEPTVHLEPIGLRSISEAASLWFGPTVAGRERASRPWPWEDD